MIALAMTAAHSSAGTFPPEQCAAFWYGRDDYAARSGFLTRNAADQQFGARFRAMAVEQAGDATKIDGFIAAQRRLMALMVHHYITGGDAQSRALYERLADACDAPRPGAP